MNVINDREVRGAFDKLLWISVGQEPGDVREHLSSLISQIDKGRTLKPNVSDKEALAEAKDAATGRKCLLVLDDVVSPCLHTQPT